MEENNNNPEENNYLSNSNEMELNSPEPIPEYNIDQNNLEEDNIEENSPIKYQENMEELAHKQFEENNEELQNIENEANDVDYENMDEDLYMQELHLRLNQMRQERKEAEKNAQLLDNRLNLLKGEELKTWKKIEKSKQKANDKLLHLQHMVENVKQREDAKRRKEIEIQNKREANQKMKNEIQANIQYKKNELRKHVEDEAKLLKLQKQYNQQLVNFLNSEKINLNKSKCSYVKSQNFINKEKKQIINHEKRMRLKEELERKLIEEYKLKEEAEAKKNKAEQEEMEVIKKLQTTTQLHKNITDQLERMNINAVLRGEIQLPGGVNVSTKNKKTYINMK